MAMLPDYSLKHPESPHYFLSVVSAWATLSSQSTQQPGKEEVFPTFPWCSGQRLIPLILPSQVCCGQWYRLHAARGCRVCTIDNKDLNIYPADGSKNVFKHNQYDSFPIVVSWEVPLGHYTGTIWASSSPVPCLDGYPRPTSPSFQASLVLTETLEQPLLEAPSGVLAPPAYSAPFSLFSGLPLASYFSVPLLLLLSLVNFWSLFLSIF